MTEGFFSRPTIFANGTNEWRLTREEIFGLVLLAIRWDDVGDEVRMGNDSHHGARHARVVTRHRAGASDRALGQGGLGAGQPGADQVLGQSYGGLLHVGRAFGRWDKIPAVTEGWKWLRRARLNGRTARGIR